MKFGPVPLSEAEGAILAHAIRIDRIALKKGEVITAERCKALAAVGVNEVVAARLEEGDVREDEAARLLASRIAGANVRCAPAFTGRVNLFAEKAGLALVTADAIDRANAMDESITIATLPNCRAVADGDMVATVKIIPFSTRGDLLAGALEAMEPGAVAVAPFRPLKISVASTLLPGLKASVVSKTVRALEARLAPTGAKVVAHETTPHNIGPLAEVLQRLTPLANVVVIFGASAITDRRDVIPAAIEAVGGRIERFGMPVDPGNLLLLASKGETTIVGAPGCARSPKENGFDWILQRVIAGVPTSDADIRAMGVGGLLTEIASRPQPRDPHE